MKKEELKKKLQHKSKNEPKIDWNFQKEKWLSHISNLYYEIDLWTTEFQEEGIFKITKTQKKITEEEIGEYDIETLSISTDDNTLILDPVGTLLIGAWGRINLTSNKGKRIFLLLPIGYKNMRDHVNIKVEIITNPSEEKAIEDKKQENEESFSYPNLEWYLLNEQDFSYIKIVNEVFYDILGELL